MKWKDCVKKQQKQQQQKKPCVSPKILFQEEQTLPLSMEFSRQEYWTGLPFPPPGDLPDPGFKVMSPAWQAVSLPVVLPGKPFLCLREIQI